MIRINLRLYTAHKFLLFAVYSISTLYLAVYFKGGDFSFFFTIMDPCVHKRKSDLILPIEPGGWRSAFRWSPRMGTE